MHGELWNLQGPHGKRFADDKDKKKVWDGLADILIELPRHPFPKTASLLPGPSPSESIVSALASERFLVHSPSGPFDSAQDYYSLFMERNLALIADGQLSTSFPMNAFLVFSLLKSQARTLAAESDHNPKNTTDKFYFKHVDAKGDHLMVGDDPKITGMIDWQMTRVGPACEEFGSSLVTAEMGDIIGACRL